MEKTNLRRVFIDISNPFLFSLLNEYGEILNASRHLDKNISHSSCQISITDKPLALWGATDGIKTHFDIENLYDSRWIDFFPRQNMAEINPYLRFALQSEQIPAKEYQKFEKALIEKQEEILQGYEGFHFLLSELCENPGVSFYTRRLEFNLRDGHITRQEQVTDQLTYQATEQNRQIHYGCRELFTMVTK